MSPGVQKRGQRGIYHRRSGINDSRLFVYYRKHLVGFLMELIFLFRNQVIFSWFSFAQTRKELDSISAQMELNSQIGFDFFKNLLF